MMDTLDEAATPPVEWDQRLMPVKIRTPATPNERVMVGRALAVAKAELEHGHPPRRRPRQEQPQGQQPQGALTRRRRPIRRASISACRR